MTKTILFDMDGVIIESNDAGAKVTADAVKLVYDIDIDFKHFRGYHGRGPRALVEGVLHEQGVQVPDIQPILDRRLEGLVFAIQQGAMPEVKGAKRLLQYLMQSPLKVGIATSSQQPKLMAVLRYLDLDAEAFDVLTTFDDVVATKPDPQIYQIAAQRAQSDPSECIVIEDAVAGVQAGKSAGMLVIGITTTTPEKDLLDAGADMIIASLEDISVHDLEIL